MLHLQTTSSERWLAQVDQSLEEILIDHAHCEQKAAATAMSLLGTYIENDELCREMTIIVQEELDHFHQVVAILRRRGIVFRKQAPGHYGSSLNALIRSNEPDRAIDRLLVAGLIEARSCERFDLLRKHIEDKELAEFYGSLFESEARHHSTYVRLAMGFQEESQVRHRLQELASAEAEIIAQANSRPRMHS
jgi:tRNA 2-(methylsulfanyl)-N6-isopentenyladenosine37 hydroxylase